MLCASVMRAAHPSTIRTPRYSTKRVTILEQRPMRWLCTLAVLLLTPATAMARPGQAKGLDRAVKQLRHEATRRTRNAWIARITENAPVTPRT